MLSNNYPEYIEIDGIKYKIDTDYKTALRCFEIIEDENIDDYERSLAVVYLLLGDIPKKTDKALELLKKYLSCGEKIRENNERPDMDLLFDQKYIIASFMSDYNIDLSKSSMHWWQYMTLIKGLTGNCILNRVREIRTMDLKPYKGKAKAELEKAKRELALPVKHSREDNEAMLRFNSLTEGNNSNDTEID